MAGWVKKPKHRHHLVPRFCTDRPNETHPQGAVWTRVPDLRREDTNHHHVTWIRHTNVKTWFVSRREVGQKCTIFRRIVWLRKVGWQARKESIVHTVLCARGWFARKLVNELKNKRYEQERQKLEKKETMLKDQEEKHKKEIERRMQPRTSEDFKVL